MAYEPLSKDDRYDAKIYQDEVKNVRDMAGGLEVITKDPENPDMAAMFGKKLEDNPTYYDLPQDTRVLRVEATNAYRAGERGLEEYVMANAMEIAHDLKTEEAKMLLANVKLESADDKYKEYIELLNERREIAEAINSKDPSKIESYVAKRIKGKAPKWKQEAFKRLNGSEYYTHHLFEEYSSDILSKLKEYETGISEDFVKELVMENVEGAQRKKDKKFMKILTEAAVPRPKEPAA